MKNLKTILLVLILGGIVTLYISCEELEELCEIHNVVDDCSVFGPQDEEEEIPVDEQPLFSQAQVCGGVGNTYGVQFGPVFYEFMSPAGDSIFWTRWKKQDDLTNDFNFFKAYFTKGDYDISTVYITTIPNEDTNFRAIVEDLQDGPEEDEVIYESHQYKPFWYYSGNNFPNPISDAAFPVYTLECDSWAGVGDTLYLVFQ